MNYKIKDDLDFITITFFGKGWKFKEIGFNSGGMCAEDIEYYINKYIEENKENDEKGLYK